MYVEDTVVSSHVPFQIRFKTDGGELGTTDELSKGFSVDYTQTSDCDQVLITG